MWLVLCAANDVAALWAYRGLKSRALEPVELVSAAMLGSSLCWEHHLGAEGVGVDITLADGRKLSSRNVQGVLNRLLAVPSQHLMRAQPDDREYAAQEFTAFFLSWLYALPGPVLNRPTPQGLCGAWRHQSEWVFLASRAGLPTSPYRQSTHTLLGGSENRVATAVSSPPKRTVISAVGEVVGTAAPPAIQEGCRRLAELAATALLGVEFASAPGGRWIFTGATPWPDLSLGGGPLLDLLAGVFKGTRGGLA